MHEVKPDNFKTSRGLQKWEMVEAVAPTNKEVKYAENFDLGWTFSSAPSAWKVFLIAAAAYGLQLKREKRLKNHQSQYALARPVLRNNPKLPI